MLTTPRRAISYPNPDRSDRPDVPTHIYNVAIAADGSVLYNQGTAAARGSATHQTSGGRVWWETDTSLAWYDDGSAWFSIGVNPNGSLAFTGSTSKLSFTAESGAGNTVLSSKISGDSVERITVAANGKISWGSGGVATDTFLSRTGVGLLKTDGTFNAVTGYQVNGTALASTHLSDTALLARLAAPVFSSPVAISDTIANIPALRMIATDAGVDYKNWRFKVNGTQFIAEIRSDDLSATTAWIQVTRTGTTVNTINFPNGIVNAAQVLVSSGTPKLQVSATGGAIDSKLWEWAANTTQLLGRTRTDADTVGATWIQVTRSGTTISSVNFVAGTLQYAGNEVAVLASPAFTGTPTGPTPAASDNTTKLATTAYVISQAGQVWNYTAAGGLKAQGMRVHRHPYASDRHIETGNAALNSAGPTTASVTFTDPFASAPNVVVTDSQGRDDAATSITTTGFTITTSAQVGAFTSYWYAEGAD